MVCVVKSHILINKPFRLCGSCGQHSKTSVNEGHQLSGIREVGNSNLQRIHIEKMTDDGIRQQKAIFRLEQSPTPYGRVLRVEVKPLGVRVELVIAGELI